MTWYENESNFPALCKTIEGEYTVIISCIGNRHLYQANDDAPWGIEHITFIAPISDVMTHYPEHLI